MKQSTTKLIEGIIEELEKEEIEINCSNILKNATSKVLKGCKEYNKVRPNTINNYLSKQ
jgi:hypothetical protein